MWELGGLIILYLKKIGRPVPIFIIFLLIALGLILGTIGNHILR